MSKGTCKSESCSKEVRAKGYCDRHYRQWRKGKLPKPRYATCNAEGCRKPRSRRGLCEDHYVKEYKKKTGTPQAAAPAPESPPAAS
jgi:hypothetical protein